MRKFGGKVLLSMALSASILCAGSSIFSTSTVHATELIANEPKLVSSDKKSNGIFDSFKSVDNVVDYICITEEQKKLDENIIMVKMGYDLLGLLEGANNSYTILTGDPENRGDVVSSSSDITDELFSGNPGDYAYNQFSLDLTKGACHILLRNSESKEIFYLGKYSSKSDIPVKDLTVNTLPTVKVTVKDSGSESATIHAEYSLDEAYIESSPNRAVIRSVELWTEDGCSESIDVEEDSKSTDFKVSSNGKYKVKVLTYSDEVMSDEVEVTSIKTTTENDDNSNKDTTAPVVTFSSFPKDVLTNTDTEIVMYSDEPAVLNFNGVSSDSYVTEMTVNVSENQEYFYTAQDESGNITENYLKIEFFTDNVISDEDRDNFWGDPLTSRLPQTGSVGFYVLIVIGVLLAGGGAFFVYKSKDKKAKIADSSDAEEEVKEEE